jgi:hypothetical protein
MSQRDTSAASAARFFRLLAARGNRTDDEVNEYRLWVLAMFDPTVPRRRSEVLRLVCAERPGTPRHHVMNAIDWLAARGELARRGAGFVRETLAAACSVLTGGAR